MQIATALSYGNTDDLITVKLSNGQTITAIAANVINSSRVLVLKEGQKYYAWGETPPQEVLRNSSGVQIVPISQEEAAEIIAVLPFQVLFTPNVQLGGDRNQLALYNSESVELGGINNLGQQQYLAVWLAGEQIIVDNNGSQSFLSVPEFLAPNLSWLGAGFLTTTTYPQKPEPDLITDVTGDSLPPDFDIPLYPIFFERFFYERIGEKTQTQQTEEYSYSETETYNYKNLKTGNAPNPLPSVFDLNVVCNFTTSGAFETQVYQRDTKTDYLKTINETLTSKVNVWFNNSVSSGDRTETYTETYDYQASAALFISSTSFRCVLIAGDPIFGFYQWTEAGIPQVNWSGETTIIDRDYTKTILEPDWDKLLTPNYARTQRHLYTENYAEDVNYNVPSNSWNIPIGTFFQFETPGTETQTISQTITEDRLTPTSLLLSGDGNSVLFVEESITLTQQSKSDRTRDIPKFLYNNSTEFPSVTSHTETTIVDKTYNQEFSLYSNGTISVINLVLWQLYIAG